MVIYLFVIVCLFLDYYIIGIFYLNKFYYNQILCIFSRFFFIDVFKRVEEKEEEEENQDTYVSKFVIFVIFSLYSGSNFMVDFNDFRLYFSIKLQFFEEKDEVNYDFNFGVIKLEDFDLDLEKVLTMVNVLSRKNGDDEDFYAIIDDVNLKLLKEDYDTFLFLFERLGKIESKDEFFLIYLELVFFSKNGVKEIESVLDEY